jgi:hypothetical protein
MTVPAPGGGRENSRWAVNALEMVPAGLAETAGLI